MVGTIPEVENADKTKGDSKEQTTITTTNESKELTEVPTECLMKHPLHHRWCLWYYDPDRTKNWQENLSEITSFDTVEDFWSLYNYIKLASEIRAGSDYSLFKEGIQPMWEDDANKRGGKWVISLNKGQRSSDLDKLWLDVILCLIGEAFEHSEDICGAVVNVRVKGDKISIWTADGNNRDGIMEIGHKLKERLRLNPKVQISYQLHKDSMVKSGSNVKSAYTL